MKKLLLLSFCAFGLVSQAQDDFWVERSTGFSATSTGVNEIKYADANNVWVVGADGSGGGAQYRVFSRSTDGGATWTPGNINLGSNDLGIGSLYPISSTVAYVAAFPNAATVQGGIWKTENSGVTWTKQTTASFNTGIESFTNIVYFFDANNGVCAGDPASGYMEIYTTTNGGTNWTRVPSSAIPTPLEGEYGYTRIYEAQGNTIWMGTNKGRIYRSRNRGLTWQVFQSPNTDFGTEIGASFTFEDENKGLMIFRDHQQFKTTDGGENWVAEFPDGTVRSGDVVNVPGFPGTYVCIGEDNLDLERGASYSIDNGATWVDTSIPEMDAISTVEFYDGTHGLTSGFTASPTVGGIYQWLGDFSTLATVDFNSAKSITASPNPTSGALRIAGKNINAVNVYDVLGKQVLAKKFSTLNEVELDLSALKSGVYMVNVANNAGANSTVKVVKQ